MARIATSIEESKRLLGLGIDPNTADMRWRYNHNEHKHDDIPQVLAVRNWDDPYNKDIPAWSLGALLDLMPCYPTYNGRILETPYYVEKHEDNSAWASCDFHEIKGEDYIDAAVKLIEWLYTGYLNIKEEKE